MSIFGDLFSNAPAKDAAAKATAIRDQGLATTTDTLDTGYGKASSYLDTAQNRFTPIASEANAGLMKYGDLLGLNGADPTAALKAMPGYQFGQDEAQQAVLRSQAGAGALASGDTLQKISDTTAGRAQQNWMQYASALQPFLQLSSTTAGQQAAVDQSQASNQTGLANTLAGYQMGVTGANATDAANAELARSAAAKNVFDAVMGVAGLGVKAATGGIIPGITPTINRTTTA